MFLEEEENKKNGMKSERNIIWNVIHDNEWLWYYALEKILDEMESVNHFFLLSWIRKGRKEQEKNMKEKKTTKNSFSPFIFSLACNFLYRRLVHCQKLNMISWKEWIISSLGE